MKRRVLLAQALVGEPDVLLLDEPTNHLDVTAIIWLEEFLASWRGTLLFVTHDRAFLRRLATRILEIDRGRIYDWSCDYETFLTRKEQVLATEMKQNALFDRKLAEEERWIRQGIKARRTRNEGRVRALKAMRSERSERREQVNTSKLKIQEQRKSGALVAETEDVSFSYENGEPIFENFSTLLMRGDKVGIIGPNGVGKTTLLRRAAGPAQTAIRQDQARHESRYRVLRSTTWAARRGGNRRTCCRRRVRHDRRDQRKRRRCQEAHLRLPSGLSVRA